MQQKGLTFEAFSMFLAANAKLFLPQPNTTPTSYQAILKLLGAKQVVNFQEHSCQCGKTLFEKCHGKSEWWDYKDDECEHCGGKRFQETKNSRGEVQLTPKCPFFYFGLKDAIRR